MMGIKTSGYMILILVQIFTQGTTNSTTEKDLLRHLFSDYEPTARPVWDPSLAVNVSALLCLVSIDQLNEREQTLKSYNWFHMQWRDEFLIWDPKEWRGMDEVVVPSSMIWTPDIVIRNSAQSLRGEFLDEDKVYRFRLLNDGTVDWWTAGSITTTCSVDMTYFPFDDQTCVIEVDSWLYPGNALNLKNAFDTINMSMYKESGQWLVLKTTIQQKIDIYYEDHKVYSYTVLKFNLFLRRKPEYYVYNIVIPSLILSLLVLLIFLLPAEGGEKVSLGITVLLSFTVFQLVIADSMPKTSDCIPMMVMYLICVMMMTGISLLCTVGVICLHHQRPETRVPLRLQKCILVLAGCLHYKPHYKDHHTHSRHSNGDFIGLTSKRNEEQCPNEAEAVVMVPTGLTRRGRELDWPTVARVIDLSLLVLFLLIVGITTLTVFVIFPFTKPDNLQ